jgi:Ca2+-binding EF-hand superfamily protein
VEINFLPTQEEEAYYMKCFKACDTDNTGHVTTTELKNALQWMNTNPFGDRKARDVDFGYVEDLRRKVDIDESYTFEFPEFVDLMKNEKGECHGQADRVRK